MSEAESGGESMASKGGKAAAKNMTPQERSERAKLAAGARWNGSLPKATHTGILKLGAAELQCAVLEDGRRLLTQETFLLAIGRSARPKAGTGVKGAGEQLDKLPSFLTADNLKPFISNDLSNSTSVVVFASEQGKKGYGFAATLLPEVCRVYTAAANAGALRHTQRHVADVCRVLLDSLADVAIIALVDEATGYQYERPRLELQEYLAQYINKRLAAWASTFPPEYYSEIYRLKGWKHDPSSTARTPEVGRLTNDLIYARLAPFVLEELRRITPRNAKGRLKHKFFQRLTKEPGMKELKDHFRDLLVISRGHDEWLTFYRHVNRALPLHPQYPDLFSNVPDSM